MAKKTVKAETSEVTKKESSIIGTFTGKCCDASVVNKNNMLLDRELFEKLTSSEEYKKAMKYRQYIGFLGHPEDPTCQDFKNACIVMTDMELRDNDEIYGTFDLIDTPVGRIAKAFIDAGVQWGISIRGAGDLTPELEYDYVQPDLFVFRGFDLVTFPAYEDAMPKFMEIAASSDPKYKKIRAAIDSNLPYISSSTAIDQIQSTLNPHSAEYKKLEARKQDIGTPEDTCPECTEQELEEITAKKLRCMTDMYIAECEKNRELEDALASTRAELKSVQASMTRKLKSIKRITASQNALMQSRLEESQNACNDLEDANRKLIVSNKRLSKKLTAVEATNTNISTELEKVNKNNLIYRQKIESSSADIEDRDVQISELQERLNKTVVASTNAKREASNRDVEVKQLQSEISSSENTIRDLESQVVACEEMLHSYQQAYADFYAKAIGTSVSRLPVTASTSVEELESLIQGATNTSNITPDVYAYEDEYIDDTDEVDEDILATL